MNAALKLEKREPVRIVPVQEIATVWPKVASYIEDALEFAQGDENLLDVLGALFKGQYLLATDGEMAAVFAYTKHPRQSVLTVLYAGGDLSACYRAFHFGREFCKANGVDVLRMWGRRGWRRILGLESIGEIMQVSI